MEKRNLNALRARRNGVIQSATLRTRCMHVCVCVRDILDDPVPFALFRASQPTCSTFTGYLHPKRSSRAAGTGKRVLLLLTFDFVGDGSAACVMQFLDTVGRAVDPTAMSARLFRENETRTSAGTMRSRFQISSRRLKGQKDVNRRFSAIVRPRIPNGISSRFI